MSGKAMNTREENVMALAETFDIAYRDGLEGRTDGLYLLESEKAFAEAVKKSGMSPSECDSIKDVVIALFGLLSDEWRRGMKDAGHDILV
jgi:hypothetical protein